MKVQLVEDPDVLGRFEGQVGGDIDDGNVNSRIGESVLGRL